MKRAIYRTLAALLVACSCTGIAVAAPVQLKPVSSVKSPTTQPQLKGRVTQSNQLNQGVPGMVEQKPQLDASPKLSGQIKKHAIWDVYESLLRQTTKEKRYVPQQSLSINSVFDALKNDSVDDGSKRFLSGLIKRWNIFTGNEDPPPLNLGILGADIWAVAEQGLPISTKDYAREVAGQQWFTTVDANEDDKISRDELQTTIQKLDAIPNNYKRMNPSDNFSYLRVRATLELLLDSFDTFDSKTNTDAYKYL